MVTRKKTTSQMTIMQEDDDGDIWIGNGEDQICLMNSEIDEVITFLVETRRKVKK